jgi:hypothetical protein
VWATFVDDPLKMTIGKQPNKPHIDPKLDLPEQKQGDQTTDKLDNCIDPALQKTSVLALHFMMAVQLGDFLDKVKVEQQ